MHGIDIRVSPYKKLVFNKLFKGVTFLSRDVTKLLPRKERPLLTKLKVLNEQTGELEEREFREQKQRKKRNKDFSFMKKAGAELLIESALAATEYRILMALIAKCEWANVVHLPRKEIADLCGVAGSVVSRSMAKLEKACVVARAAADPSRIYINPLICWMGDPDAVWSAHSRFLEGRRSGVLPAEVGNLFGEGPVELATRGDLKGT